MFLVEYMLLLLKKNLLSATKHVTHIIISNKMKAGLLPSSSSSKHKPPYTYTHIYKSMSLIIIFGWRRRDRQRRRGQHTFYAWRAPYTFLTDKIIMYYCKPTLNAIVPERAGKTTLWKCLCVCVCHLQFHCPNNFNLFVCELQSNTNTYLLAGNKQRKRTGYFIILFRDVCFTYI